MHRGIVATVALTGATILILAVSLGKTGVELDQIRMERADLQTQVDTLHRQLDRLSGQRQSLQGQIDEHVRAIEQLKHEMERERVRAQTSAAGSVRETARASD